VKRKRGRPRVRPADKARTHGVSLTDIQLVAIDELAERTGRSRSEVVRWALRELWSSQYPGIINPF
jgi:metal-responsive CopG/Arc/MetJ family transcriptional regulator